MKRLLLLAVVMTGLWLLSDPLAMTSEEQVLWERVRACLLYTSDAADDLVSV